MNYPFGQPVSRVRQRDRGPKRVFILGVYASAVHATWLDADGKAKVNALVVASEPYIFWRGEDAESIVRRIELPAGAGSLVPAPAELNGPSGKSLDADFIAPLSVGGKALTREDCWLCDLVPHSCLNPNQGAAINRAYAPLVNSHGLLPALLPPVPQVLADERRQAEILAELKESGAEVLMLLGDDPIKWFLSAFSTKWTRLSDFGTTNETYGRFHEVQIAGKSVQVLPLCHPRQAAALGTHCSRWNSLHSKWKAVVQPIGVSEG